MTLVHPSADVQTPLTHFEIDGAIAVRAPRADVALRERLEHGRMRMAEEVVAPAGDDREARRDVVEQRFRSARTAAVMRDLEHVRAQVDVGEIELRLLFDVAGEEDAAALRLDLQDD